MFLEVPVRRVENLPDTAEVRLAVRRTWCLAPIAVATTPSWRRAVIIKAPIALANLAAAICLVILPSPSTDRARQDSSLRIRSKTNRWRSAVERRRFETIAAIQQPNRPATSTNGGKIVSVWMGETLRT